METSVKQTPSSKALILLIGPTEKQDKTATHDHCLLKVKIWVVYPTFSAESYEGLVGVKRKRTIKEREKIEKKREKGRKEEKRKQHLPNRNSFSKFGTQDSLLARKSPYHYIS